MTSITLPPPFHAVVLETVDSTNEEAKRRAEQGGRHGMVVFASEQTAGRGRRGRVWESPRGNMHCSVLLRTGRPLAETAQLSFAAGIALVDALGIACPGLPVGCKWPNDVLSGGRKLSGTLLEAANDASYVILGLGVNVSSAPPAVMYPTLALAEAGYAVAPEALLAIFCDCFAPWLELWQKEGFARLRQPWLDRAYGLGAPITVRLSDREMTGVFAGLDANGALLLEQAGGICQSVLAGDVFFPGRT